MKRSIRFSIGASVVALSGSMSMYACSEDKTGTSTTTPEGGTTPTGEAGTDTGGTDTGTGTVIPDNPDTGPKSCPFVDNGGAEDAGRNLEPPACKRCVAERCCNQITKCYSGTPADAGLDGSDGKKTACKLYEECEIGCMGALLCEAKCGIDIGQGAANDYGGSEGCIYGAAPAGCKDVCP
jgi:hypothetical protein